MKTTHDYKKPAVIISLILIISAACSLLYLLLPGSTAADSGYIAEIYQDGRLIRSIYLKDIQQSQTFIIENPQGGVNEIEIRPNGIGIISANCPDKLCVRQGLITDGRLPITCLPNKLVILLHPVPNDADANYITHDTITY